LSKLPSPWTTATTTPVSVTGGSLTTGGGSGMANPMTAVGDVIIGGTAGSPVRKALGANGTFLGVSGGVLGYYTPSAGAAAWGSITGTLSSQSDLNTALAGKLGTSAQAADSAHLNSQPASYYQVAYTILSTLGGLLNAAGVLTNNGSGGLSWGAGSASWPVTGTPAIITVLGSLANAAGVLTNNGSGTLSWGSSLTNPMTAQNDMIYAVNPVGSPTRLANAAGILMSGPTGAGGVPTWSTQPVFDALNVSNIQVAALSGNVPTNHGGTGFAGPYTQYGIPYASTTTSFGTTLAGTTAQVLIGNASGAPTWGSVNLTTMASGLLAPGLGGTGSTFFSPTGPTALRTYTFPDANSTMMATTTAVLAAQMPALTGDVTTVAGAVATTLATTQSAAHTWGAAQTWSLSSTFTQAAIFTAYAGGTTAGMLWYDSTQLTHGRYAGGVKQMTPGVLWTQTADGTNGSATAATSILGTGVGTTTIPGSFFMAGKTVRIKGTGTFTTAATPGTVTLTFQLGAVVVATSIAVTPTISLTNKHFEYEFLLTCRSATTIQGGGSLRMDAAIPLVGVPNTTTATIVNATAYAVNILSANSVASGCVWTTKTCVIEILN